MVLWVWVGHGVWFGQVSAFESEIFLQVEQVERGLKQAELDGRRKAEEVQAVKNKVLPFVSFFTSLLPSFCVFCLFFRKGKFCEK